jgi:hypothetical protein
MHRSPNGKLYVIQGSRFGPSAVSVWSWCLRLHMITETDSISETSDIISTLASLISREDIFFCILPSWKVYIVYIRLHALENLLVKCHGCNMCPFSRLVRKRPNFVLYARRGNYRVWRVRHANRIETDGRLMGNGDGKMLAWRSVSHWRFGSCLSEFWESHSVTHGTDEVANHVQIS